MRVFITGGTGLIGGRLVRRLVERGDTPVVLSRRAEEVRVKPQWRGIEVLQGDPSTEGAWERAVDGCDAVVNLVGHNIFADRWTDAVRRKIRDSRVLGTEHVVSAIARSARRPGVLVQGSAIGYYGPHGDEELTEESPPGNDFMAEVCREWEGAAVVARECGTRVPLIRTGIVLARDEGALGVMAPLFRRGLGAPIGSGGSPLGLFGVGRQWMSWIHLEDIVGIILMALDRSEGDGPINGTAPQPVPNKTFGRELARALRRGGIWPPFLFVGPPNFVLKTILGEVAQVITEGQRVLPARALALGYQFQFLDLPGALRDLFPKGAERRAAPQTTPTAGGPVASGTS